jgi:hypothetical protein
MIKKGEWTKVPGMHDLSEAVLGVGLPDKKSLYLRIYDWNAEQLKEDKVRYTTFDAFVSFRIGEILHNDYGCNLRLSPTPVPDSSPTLEKDSEEEEEEQEHKKILKGKDLQLSEDRKTNTIASCPVCRQRRGSGTMP